MSAGGTNGQQRERMRRQQRYAMMPDVSCSDWQARRTTQTRMRLYEHIALTNRR